MSKTTSGKKKLALHWKIIIGMLLGVIWALISSTMGWSEFTINWIDPFGTIFINLLKLIAVPLVLLSIISGVSNLGDTVSLGKIGGKTLLIFISTSFLAIGTGLLLVNIINPGGRIDQDSLIENRLSYEIWATSQGHEIKDGIHYHQMPEHQERVQRMRSISNETLSDEEISQRLEAANQMKEAGPLQMLVDVVPENFFFSLSNNTLMLQIIFFGIFFSISLLFIPKEQSEPVIKFINGFLAVFLKMVDFVMQAAPFFVFALLAGVVSKMAGDDVGKVIEIFKGLSWYTLTVLIGLLLFIFILYPLAVKLFTKKITYRGFLKGMSPAQALAFSTSSSAATLPVTMECIENNLGVNKKISSFVLPIGATINMDGTSLYQAIAVVFLAQMHMIDLTMTQQLIIVVTATLASIGAAPVPSAGLVMLIIIMESVGLNPAWIAIIFPVDRILDMVRTVVNVTGDAVVCTIVANGENMIEYEEHENPSETFDLDSK
ncbi:MAG TPA: dicarboxylate/amino acid:cation symporter [Flavobacterium sp.]|nr:dicarboxylate/amino acid:cation symporter [Flavobacterium sp.]